MTAALPVGAFVVALLSALWVWKVWVDLRAAERALAELIGVIRLQSEIIETIREQIVDAGYTPAHGIPAAGGDS